MTGWPDEEDGPSAELVARPRRREPANRVAESILDRARVGGHGGFVSDRWGLVYRYTGAYWERQTVAQLRALALGEDGPFASTAERRNEIVSFLTAASYVEGFVFGRVEDHEVPTRNGVVDVRNGRLRPHRPDDYLDSVLDVDYDPAARAPRWERALLEWFDDTDDRVVALQEFFGYVALPHARYKMALVLYGPGDTGKSVAPMVMRALVGAEFTTSLGVDKMDDEVLRAAIEHKRLNLVTEITSDALVRDGGFKAMISTGEPIQINPKFEPARSIVPVAKHVFATNQLPRVSDQSEATFNRLLIIPYDRILARETQDRTLLDALAAELPGILNWSIEGARRLIAAGGQFTQPAAAGALKGDLREATNPVRAFLAEKLVPDPTACEPVSGLVALYNRWAGGATRTTLIGLGRMLARAGCAVEERRIGADGRRARCLLGWRLPAMTAPETY